MRTPYHLVRIDSLCVGMCIYRGTLVLELLLQVVKF